MGSALLNTPTLDPAFAEEPGELTAADVQAHVAARTSTPPSTEALRRQVAERLAAHRSRRDHSQRPSAQTPEPATPHSASTRSSRIAAAVAQRYAHSPSYQAFLAEEAERATQQAHAAAQVAALNAQAVAAAQQQLLESFKQKASELEAVDREPQGESQVGIAQELTLWPEEKPVQSAAPVKRSRPAEPSRAFTPPSHAVAPRPATQRATAKPQSPASAGLTVRLYEDEASAARVDLSSPLRIPTISRKALPEDRSADEARALDEEIAFRQSPVFEEPAGPPMPLPANLIEFPRQLVASRKARPRYAEGPLRDDVPPAPGDGQLRIFEVDPAQIATTPVDIVEAAAPQWDSLWLDAPGTDTFADPAQVAPSAADQPEDDVDVFVAPRAQTVTLPGIASIARRLLAVAIDASILVFGFMAFAASFLFAACHSMPVNTHLGLARLAAQIADQTGIQLRVALTASFATLAVLYLLYQALFFSYAEATPGMRCARIALCTFDDENPTRRTQRRRVLAILISICPLGFGLLWAALDEDRLTWHDRLTRTYQRSY